MWGQGLHPSGAMGLGAEQRPIFVSPTSCSNRFPDTEVTDCNKKFTCFIRQFHCWGQIQNHQEGPRDIYIPCSSQHYSQ